MDQLETVTLYSINRILAEVQKCVGESFKQNQTHLSEFTTQPKNRRHESQVIKPLTNQTNDLHNFTIHRFIHWTLSTLAHKFVTFVWFPIQM